jgi:hypothetical protein
MNNGCESDLCFAGSGAPGFCGKFCNSADEFATCGGNGTCWRENNRGLTNLQDSGGTTGYPLGQFRNVDAHRTSGACLKRCATSADCPGGFYCGEYNGARTCIPGAAMTAQTPPTGTGTPGQYCTASAQCASGSCVFPTGFALGICEKASAAACPGNTLATGLTPDLCARTCVGDLDNECSGGAHTCVDFGLASLVCLPNLCHSNDDCVGGRLCDPNSGDCVVAIPSTGGEIGTACTTGADCKSGQCFAQQVAPPLFVGGYCMATCTRLPDLSDTCPNGALCVNTIAIGAEGLCFDLCDTGGLSRYGACRPAYNCTPLSGDTRFGICTSI